MIFEPPTWLPAITQDLSTVKTVSEFVLRGLVDADAPVLVSAATQQTRSPRQYAKNVEALAAGLANELQWTPNERAEGGKVVAILSENTVGENTQKWPCYCVKSIEAHVEQDRLCYVLLGCSSSSGNGSSSAPNQFANRECKTSGAERLQGSVYFSSTGQEWLCHCRCT